MLWTSAISGLPGSIPISAKTGISRSPNASHCCCESQNLANAKVAVCAEADVLVHPVREPVTGLLEAPLRLVVLLGDHGCGGEADNDAHRLSSFGWGSSRTYPTSP